MSNESNNTIGKYLGPDFQKKLIWQLLVEPEFAKNVLPELKVEYFDDDNLKRLFIIMHQYYRDHDKVPNLQNGSIDDALHKYAVTKNEVENEVLWGKLNQIKLWNERVINKNQLYDGDVVREDTINFIKQQEYRKLAEYIIGKTKTGEIKSTSFNFEVEEKINKIYHIGDEEDYGTDAIDDIDHALSHEFRETIPTGIGAIDAVTGNGLGRGEIGLILAPSGVGKTTILTKIANNGFNEGKKVLQIVFEDTIKQIQRKHYAIWSDVKLSEIDENRDFVKDKVLDKYNKVKKEGGKIDIVKFSQEDTTIHTIKNWIARQIKKFGYGYDMIVLDYLDCLEPNRREKELLSAELQIVKSFEAMAAEYDIPCWSAIQTNRSGFNAEFVELQSTGGNIKRIQKSHFVMSIAKPDKSDNSHLANMKILKARFAEDGHEFKECIFNNDSLEIRVTDQKYFNGVKTKKYDDTDAEKMDEKAKRLTEGQHHANISSKVYDYSPPIGSQETQFRLNKETEKVINASNSDKSTVSLSGDNKADYSPPKSIPEETGEEISGVDEGNSMGTSIPEEASNSMGNNNHHPEKKHHDKQIKEDDDIDPDEFLSKCQDEFNDEPNEQLDFLSKMRKEQGDVIKSSKKT